MIKQFIVPPELQQFLSGLPGRSLTNVVWDIQFPAAAPVLPTNPGTTRRSLVFDKLTSTGQATPTVEYNTFIVLLDGTAGQNVSVPRGI